VFDPRQRAGIDAGFAAFRDALVQTGDLLLDGVDGVARHRFGERARPMSPSSARNALIASSTPVCAVFRSDW